MHFLRVRNLSYLAVAFFAPTLLFADYTYQQVSQITGGSILKMMKLAGAFSSQARKVTDPIVSTIYLKENRLANVAPDSIEIIDLDKETITHIDPEKRTYTVVTFAEMREQVAKAAQQMQKNQTAKPADTTPSNPNADDVKMSFDVKVRKTGAEKEVSGLAAQEAILTLMMNATDQQTQQTGSMAITNDMWLAPEIPGYQQVRDFYVRMASKMGGMTAGVGMDLSRFLAQHPGATQAMTDMGKEMQKIKGVPVMQVMRLGASTDGKPLPAASEAPLPADNSPAMPSGSDVAKQSAASAISSRLGGFGLGGFGHKKQDSAPPADQNSNQGSQATPTNTILMETQITYSNFSSGPVDAVHFEVPAGFKQFQAATH